MLRCGHITENSLRNRLEYQLLDDGGHTRHGHELEVDSMRPLQADAVGLDMNNLKPLVLERLNRESIAFGMVVPKKDTVSDFRTRTLREILDHAEVEVKSVDSNDENALGVYTDNGRYLGMSASRDKARGLALHIYELSETPIHLRRFNQFSYMYALRHIRQAIYKACEPSIFIRDRSTGELDSEDHLVKEIYDPRLSEAKMQGEVQQKKLAVEALDRN